MNRNPHANELYGGTEDEPLSEHDALDPLDAKSPGYADRMLDAADQQRKRSEGEPMTYDIAPMMEDGLSQFDIAHLTEIIRDGMGDWYHAKLMRALDALMPKADSVNMARLEGAYPGSCAAYRVWYNDPQGLAEAAA